MRAMSEGKWLGANAVLIVSLLIQGYCLVPIRSFLYAYLLGCLISIGATIILTRLLERRLRRTSRPSRLDFVSFVVMFVLALISFLWTEVYQTAAPFFYAVCVTFGTDLWGWAANRYFKKENKQGKPPE